MAIPVQNGAAARGGQFILLRMLPRAGGGALAPPAVCNLSQLQKPEGTPNSGQTHLKYAGVGPFLTRSTGSSKQAKDIQLDSRWAGGSTASGSGCGSQS
jgi:hypothetical protein